MGTVALVDAKWTCNRCKLLNDSGTSDSDTQRSYCADSECGYGRYADRFVKEFAEAQTLLNVLNPQTDRKNEVNRLLDAVENAIKKNPRAEESVPLLKKLGIEFQIDALLVLLELETRHIELTEFQDILKKRAQKIKGKLPDF